MGIVGEVCLCEQVKEVYGLKRRLPWIVMKVVSMAAMVQL